MSWRIQDILKMKTAINQDKHHFIYRKREKENFKKAISFTKKASLQKGIQPLAEANDKKERTKKPKGESIIGTIVSHKTLRIQDRKNDQRTFTT